MVIKLAPSALPLQYKFNRKAGKCITSAQPVFSPDGESVLVVVENVVRVYSIQTAECTRTLETEKDVESLVGVRFPENEKFNLYGCSNKGLVSIWTWANGTILREIQLQLQSGTKVVSFELLDSNECFIVGTKPDDKYFYLASFSIKTGKISIEYKATRVPCKNILSVSLGWCDGDRYAAICNGTMAFYIQNLIQPHLRTVINNHNKLRVISASAHPRESSVVISDTLGRVTVIRGYLYDYNNLAKEVLHWHYLPVLATCFSREGSYLYSGGIEKVLVKWTSSGLSHRSQEKQVIPRLPGIIKYIATDNVNVAISLTNNCIVIANGQMRVVSTILECGGLCGQARALGPDLVYHRGSGALLLAGRPGHLQMYSTITNHLLFNIDITQVNSIPPSRENILPLELEVSCVATSANGNWLVTSEYRNDAYMYPEERLKFWAAHTKGSTPFKLNTCVNLSHGGCRVVSIALSNNGTFCVSAGLDQKFRIWKCNTNIEGKKKTFSWSCLTACYYSTGFSQSTAHEILNDYKNSVFNKADKEDCLSYLTEYNTDDIVERLLNINLKDTLDDKLSSCVKNSELAMGGVAISQDGSLISAWFGNKLTLWDTHQCTLRTTLAHPVLKSNGLQARFGNNDAAHYLVCTTEDCLAVWSLLSLSLKWHVNIKPSCLAADPFSNKLAVVTDLNDVCVFTPHSPNPVLKRERLLERSSGVFARCSFALAAKDEVRLYLMRNDSEIYCLEPEESSESRLEVISRRALPASNFSALLAEQQLSEVKPLQATELEYLNSDTIGKSAISQFLSGAPHMMPPVSLLCTSFLEHISGSKVVEPVDEPNTIEVDNDPSSDEEDFANTNEKAFKKKVDLWTPNYEQVKLHKLKKILKDKSLDIDATLSLF